MRVIAIQGAAPAVATASACNEDVGEVPRMNLPLARREFLKGSGVLMGTLVTGSLLASLAPSPVWAVELKVLSKAEGEALMAMGRVLYPHEKLPDAVYAFFAGGGAVKFVKDWAAAGLQTISAASNGNNLIRPCFSIRGFRDGEGVPAVLLAAAAENVPMTRPCRVL